MMYDTGGAPFDYRFILVNPAFERFIGLPKDQVVGKNARSILPKMNQR